MMANGMVDISRWNPSIDRNYANHPQTEDELIRTRIAMDRERRHRQRVAANLRRMGVDTNRYGRKIKDPRFNEPFPMAAPR